MTERKVWIGIAIICCVVAYVGVWAWGYDSGWESRGDILEMHRCNTCDYPLRMPKDTLIVVPCDHCGRASIEAVNIK